MAKRWIKNDEDDFDIGVTNGVEYSPDEFLQICWPLCLPLSDLLPDILKKKIVVEGTIM